MKIMGITKETTINDLGGRKPRKKSKAILQEKMPKAILQEKIMFWSPDHIMAWKNFIGECRILI